MKKICLAAFLLVRAAVCLAQVGVDSSLGLSSLPTSFSVGAPDTLGAISLPTCNAALTDCAVALPVNLLDFDGRRLSKQYVDLQWKTTSEISDSGFWVERSFGSPDNFSPDFFVPSLQNTDLVKQYERPDTNSYQGKTFYRLDQLDLDGKGTYSKVIEVDGLAADVLTVFPNPSRGIFYLQYPPAADGQPYMIRVYDPYGQVISAGRVSSVDLSGQASGVYTIECLGDRSMLARIVLLK